MKAGGSLSKRISLLVEEAGSARRFADIAGVQNPTVLGWMNGSQPYAKNLRQICERTGVSLEWLRDGKGNDQNELETFAESTRGVASRRWQDDSETENNRLKEEPEPYARVVDARHFSEALLAEIIAELSAVEKLSADERLRLVEPYQSELRKRIRSRVK